VKFSSFGKIDELHKFNPFSIIEITFCTVPA